MAAKQKMSPFPPTFFVANVMEIFERMAWYGFFAVSSLYLTSPIAQGGLGFTSTERGILQGVIPFLLYLFPVITGALADRYGYRNTFLVAFAIMTPSYWLLGQVSGFWSFFGVFLLVAIGAATFKPVVVGTVGRLTDDTNRGMGFGIFYTIVNVGGFVGPLVAGYVRAISWDLVFVMSAIWIGLNFIPTLFFYKEPPGGDTGNKKSIKQVLLGAQEVLGNGRFALLVVPIIVSMMVSGGGWMSWNYTLIGSAVWIILNLLWNAGVKNSGDNAPWFRQKAQIGNWPFVVYLLILAGFWASFNQIFITLPEYIRDFVDTGHLVNMMAVFGQGTVDFLASVNIEQLSTEIQRLASQYSHIADDGQAQQLLFELVHYKVRVPLEEITTTFNSFAGSVDAATATALANEWAGKYRQINPEYLVNLDALSIVIFQILVSFVIQRWKPFPVLIVGTIVAGTGIALNSIAVTGVLVVFAIVVFAFGEMIASPKSQEYVAKIAPPGKTALFMGYYFVSVALGNLFGGILSGQGYDVIAKEHMNPSLMWLIFGGVGFLTAIALMVFNKVVVPTLEKQEQMS